MVVEPSDEVLATFGVRLVAPRQGTAESALARSVEGRTACATPLVKVD
jgi:hypothetical protein